ncbi:hypothetical protein HJ590_13175 [Naumannella sp. ID2617S]|nr:hypothetical protein [Naumannella sp. ID2617S]
MNLRLFTETVKLRTLGKAIGEDRYGKVQREPDTDVSCPAWWEPRSSTENVAAKDQIVSGYWLYLPPTAQAHFDQVILPDGKTYEVVGEAGFQPGGFVVEGYYTMAIERVTG